MLPPDMYNLAKIVMASSILAGVPAHAVTEINYWLWDNNQRPSYEACAAAFEKQNPDIKIKITQTGWFDYWSALSTAFVSGTAPDVFPAIPEATEIAKARMAAKGVDVSAFVEEAKDPQGTLFLPITEHGNDSVRILRATFDAIFLDGADAAPKLTSANQEIDSLFQ